MAFQGIRDFRTETPAVLRADLQRLNGAIESAFTEAGRTLGQWKPVHTSRTTRIDAGSAVFVDAAGAVTIFLPSSNSANAARCVRVCRVNGSAAITLVAPANEAVNGAASVALSSSSGWSEFMADGKGGWWVNH